MTLRRWTLGIRGLLLVAALAAAAPTVRWCPLRWDQIDAARFAQCTTMVAVGLPGCGPARAAARAPSDDCRSACTARPGVATCPLADAATGQAPRTRAPGSHRHAYFLGDAAFARAVRATARPFASPLRVAAVPAGAAAIVAPARAATEPPRDAEARPPNRAATAPPPARAPPPSEA